MPLQFAMCNLFENERIDAVRHGKVLKSGNVILYELIKFFLVWKKKNRESHSKCIFDDEVNWRSYPKSTTLLPTCSSICLRSTYFHFQYKINDEIWFFFFRILFFVLNLISLIQTIYAIETDFCTREKHLQISNKFFFCLSC